MASPSLSGRLTSLAPRRATRDEILRVHSDRHYEEVLATRESDRTCLDEDTVTSAESAEIALLAAGSVLTAVDAVWENEVEVKNGRKTKVYSVQIDRTYKDGDEFKRTSRFNVNDLPKVQMLAQKAYVFVSMTSVLPGDDVGEESTQPGA